MDTLPITWDEVLDWGIKELKGGGLKKLLCKLSLGAVVYNIWSLLYRLPMYLETPYAF